MAAPWIIAAWLAVGPGSAAAWFAYRRAPLSRVGRAATLAIAVMATALSVPFVFSADWPFTIPMTILVVDGIFLAAAYRAAEWHFVNRLAERQEQQRQEHDK